VPVLVDTTTKSIQESIVRHPRLLIAGIGLVAVTAVGGVAAASVSGSSNTYRPAAGSSTSTGSPTTRHASAQQPGATMPGYRNAVPQPSASSTTRGDAGDHDADNSGGPSDGDGNI
jgi:hypothetical protein